MGLTFGNKVTIMFGQLRTTPMKQYQKKRKINDILAPTSLDVLPTFETCDPVEGTTVYIWYDKEGEYQGWCDIATGKKFLLGKLYYKTKGAYRIRTRRSHDNREVQKISIYQKNSSLLAAFAVCRRIVKEDLIELNDREGLAKITLEAVEKHQFTAWNFSDYPNQYGIVPIEIRTKFQKDLQDFLISKKKELTDYLQLQITDAQQAKVITAKNTEVLAGEWDMASIL